MKKLFAAWFREKDRGDAGSVLIEQEAADKSKQEGYDQSADENAMGAPVLFFCFIFCGEPGESGLNTAGGGSDAEGIERHA